jgi:hypothetical protein
VNRHYNPFDPDSPSCIPTCKENFRVTQPKISNGTGTEITDGDSKSPVHDSEICEPKIGISEDDDSKDPDCFLTKDGCRASQLIPNPEYLGKPEHGHTKQKSFYQSRMNYIVYEETLESLPISVVRSKLCITKNNYIDSDLKIQSSPSSDVDASDEEKVYCLPWSSIKSKISLWIEPPSLLRSTTNQRLKCLLPPNYLERRVEKTHTTQIADSQNDDGSTDANDPLVDADQDPFDTENAYFGFDTDPDPTVGDIPAKILDRDIVIGADYVGDDDDIGELVELEGAERKASIEDGEGGLVGVGLVR